MLHATINNFHESVKHCIQATQSIIPVLALQQAFPIYLLLHATKQYVLQHPLATEAASILSKLDAWPLTTASGFTTKMWSHWPSLQIPLSPVMQLLTWTPPLSATLSSRCHPDSLTKLVSEASPNSQHSIPELVPPMQTSITYRGQVVEV